MNTLSNPGITDLGSLARLLLELMENGIPFETSFKSKIVEILLEKNVCGFLMIAVKNGTERSHPYTKTCLKNAFDLGKLNVFEYTLLYAYFNQF